MEKYRQGQNPEAFRVKPKPKKLVRGWVVLLTREDVLLLFQSADNLILPSQMGTTSTKWIPGIRTTSTGREDSVSGVYSITPHYTLAL